MQTGSFTIGSQTKTLFCIHKFSRNYRLIPNSGFDANNYISNITTSSQSYTADIQSRNCRLLKAKFESDGKTIYLLVHYDYKASPHQSDVPSLIIYHRIPGP